MKETLKFRKVNWVCAVEVYIVYTEFQYIYISVFIYIFYGLFELFFHEPYLEHMRKNAEYLWQLDCLKSEKLFSLFYALGIICWDRDNRCCSDKQDHFCYHSTTAEINLLDLCNCLCVRHPLYSYVRCLNIG